MNAHDLWDAVCASATFAFGVCLGLLPWLLGTCAAAWGLSAGLRRLLPGLPSESARDAVRLWSVLTFAAVSGACNLRALLLLLAGGSTLDFSAVPLAPLLAIAVLSASSAAIVREAKRKVSRPR